MKEDSFILPTSSVCQASTAQSQEETLWLEGVPLTRVSNWTRRLLGYHTKDMLQSPHPEKPRNADMYKAGEEQSKAGAIGVRHSRNNLLPCPALQVTPAAFATKESKGPHSHHRPPADFTSFCATGLLMHPATWVLPLWKSLRPTQAASPGLCGCMSAGSQPTRCPAGGSWPLQPCTCMLLVWCSSQASSVMCTPQASSYGYGSPCW